MPSPVEQTLSALLPTTSLLPPLLISTAGALLAQSKHAAPTLKNEEEIARTYACCHIACARLMNKLALDIGKINPPCGPRVYKKLHGYLDGVLTSGASSQPATPSTSRKIDVSKMRTPTNVVSSTKDATISGRKSTSTVTNPKIDPTKTPRSSAKRKRQEDGVEQTIVPEAMAQLSQHLCRGMKLPEATPHMYAGMESAWPSLSIEEVSDDTDTKDKRQRKPSAKAEALQTKSTKLTVDINKVPLVVIAMFHSTITQLRDAEVTTDEAEDIFGDALSFLRDKDEDLAEAVYDDNYANIARSVTMLNQGLQSLPFWASWFENVPRLNVDIVEDRVVDHEDDTLLARAKPSKTPLRRKEKHTHAEDGLLGPSGLLPGLGTMFQPAVDWLSDERRADYAIWQRGIMREIAAIEQKASPAC